MAAASGVGKGILPAAHPLSRPTAHDFGVYWVLRIIELAVVFLDHRYASPSRRAISTTGSGNSRLTEPCWATHEGSSRITVPT